MDVEQLVPEDHEVRGVWEFVGRLDLSQYDEDIEARAGEAGRPAMDPRLMISLWIYAYSKGVSSAREVCRLCESDPAYQWLTGMEGVNYHTLIGFPCEAQRSFGRVVHRGIGVIECGRINYLRAGDA